MYQFGWKFAGSLSKVLIDLFTKTKVTVYFCVNTREWFVGFTVDYEEGQVEERLILGAVCDWYNVWHGLTLAFELIIVWNGLLLVQLNEKVSTKICGVKEGLDSAGTVANVVFSINVWSIDLFGWLVTVWLFSVWLI